jgi:hypothetical protein
MRATRAMRAALVVLVAGCGAQAAPPHNGAREATSPLTIAPDQPLGWIAIAPRAARAPGDWIPAGPQAAVLPMPSEGIAAGTTLSAIDTAGRVTRVTADGAAKVPYGCDSNQLDVVAFTGDRSAPGPVWLLPPAAPEAWQPHALAIVSPVSAVEDRRRDTVGPLTLELARSDATHGTLAIMREGRAVHKLAIERAAIEGADAGPLDLSQPGVAIPVPVAAWSLVDGGPILLVLLVPSYEGIHLTALLVEAGAARELPALAVYLYRCAF